MGKGQTPFRTGSDLLKYPRVMLLELEFSKGLPAGLRVDAARLFAAIGTCQSVDELRAVPILLGSRLVEAGEIVDWRGSLAADSPAVTAGGDWSHVDGVGAGWRRGFLDVQSSAGHRAGKEMSGGQIRIAGNAADDAAQGMTGGSLKIQLNAGARVGGPLPGRAAGMNCGQIAIGGNAGRHAGWRMRRGTLFVAGSCGELAGYELRGGNVVIAGSAGPMAGHDCRRGSLVVFGPRPEIGPGFRRCGLFRTAFLKLLVHSLGRAEFQAAGLADRPMELFHGDWLHGSRGELWVNPETALTRGGG